MWRRSAIFYRTADHAMQISFCQPPIAIRIAAGTLLLFNWTTPARLEAAQADNPRLAASPRILRFETDILPIFKSSCVPCHNPHSRAKGLDLTTLVSVMKGSEAGPVLAEKSPSESILYKVIQSGAMPKGGKPLLPEQLTLIRQWIEAGESLPVTFATAIEPIFKTNCVKCHGPGSFMKAMDLSTYAGVMKGSESGPVIVPRNPESSLIYKKVRAGTMPKDGPPLSKEQIATIQAWIEEGALPASSKTSVALEPLSADDILPILFLRCTACHGPGRTDGGLDLTSREAMLKGGKSGPAIVPGKPDQSLIVQ